MTCVELHEKWVNDELGGKRLVYADLTEEEKANLCRADLRGANLYRANLSGADLSGADLGGARYNVLSLLQCDWGGEITDGLRAQMMAFDRDCHNDPDAFLEWANGGGCPCSKNIQRALQFREKRDCYDHDLTAPTPWALWEMLATEFEIVI